MKPQVQVALVATILACSPLANAVQAETYPSRSTTILVPYAPGGITDILGRLIAQDLSIRLGQSFVVENKPGGGTVLATQTLIQARPDGYTLLMVPNGTLAINPTMYKSLPYKVENMKPVALVGSLPFVLVANNDLPVKTVQDLVKLAKKTPGKLNYGSGGAGTNGDVFMRMFASISDIDMVHVPFRGSAPQLSATIADQVQVGFVDANSATALIKAGKLRAIAVTSRSRFAGLPDVPTMQEAGVQGYEAESWQMLVAPAGTPAAILDLLHARVYDIIQSAQVRDKLKGIGVNPGEKKSIRELEGFISSEAARWGAVIQKAGLAGKL